ncbi:hypothetical protein [Roseovarius pacificus]|uniref:hypothetical protein n=1 Tax=Roseovarius pacificus TaxID=337701 RepID=UPI004039CF6E
MRFFRLARRFHMAALAALIAVAIPFALPDMPAPGGDQSQHAAMQSTDCDSLAAIHGNGAECPGMSLHCLSFVVLDVAPIGRIHSVSVQYLPRIEIRAIGISPQASFPPPRA